MTRKTASARRQSGVVLAVSLIMLLVLTLIGVTGMQTTGLEEKMASNSRDQSLAFQSAEAALRGGESALDGISLISDFDGTNGLLGENDALPSFDTSATWSASNSVEFDSGISSNLVATQPRYFIKYIKEVSDDININNDSSRPTAYFIVTSRGTGRQNTSQVYLRSAYARKF